MSDRTMTDEHKEAIRAGQSDGKVIRAYLEALETSQPKRGRQRSPQRTVERIDAIRQEIPLATPLKRVSLIQEKLDLMAWLESHQAGSEDRLKELERSFAGIVKGYSARKGITAKAWREAGVPRSVLNAGGVS